jgi:hypothetical protein
MHISLTNKNTTLNLKEPAFLRVLVRPVETNNILSISKYWVVFLCFSFCFFGLESNAQCPFSNSSLNACSGISFFQGINPPSVTYSWGLPAISPAGSLAGATTGNQSPNFQQTLTNNTNSSAQAVYTITPLNSNCNPGFTYQITVTVFPKPTVTVLANQTICAGVSTQPIIFSGPIANTSFSQWANSNANIGLSSIGNGNISAFSATNTFTTNITSVISITPFANGCAGDPTDVTTITVKPIPNVFSSSNQSICEGVSSTAINLTSSVPNTTFQWVNSNASIGLPSSGNSNVPSFVTANSTNQNIVGTISAIPTSNQCVGESTVISAITVKPKPTADLLPNIEVCNGGQVQTIVFTGPVTNTTFSSWSNSNSLIGLQSSGSGNIPQFNTVNFSTTPIVGSISVTPVASGCIGDLTVVKVITVRPSPTVNQVADISICGGNQVTVPSFNANIANSVFFWQNNNISIGLSAQSQGNISPFFAQNPGNSISSATILVRAAEVGCSQGNAMSFNINIKPLPTISLSSTLMEKCSNQSSSPIQITSNLSNASFNWQHTAQQIINLPITGNTYPIPAFDFFNNTNSAILDSIIFTSSFDGCVGQSATLQLNVFPVPIISGITELLICSGEISDEIIFSSSLPNSTFSWSNNNSAIGLSQAGNSNVIPSFLSTNISADTIYANVTILATSVNSCASDTNLVIAVLPELMPIADFVYSSSGTGVLFALTETDASSNIFWDFGDGSFGQGDSINHVYAENGIYTITASVINSCGDSAVSSQTLNLSVGILTNNSIEEIIIYPNPFTDLINVRLGNFKFNHTFIEVKNITGKIVFQEYFDSFDHQIKINFDFLEPGLYYFKTYDSINKTTKKIIKL